MGAPGSSTLAATGRGSPSGEVWKTGIEYGTRRRSAKDCPVESCLEKRWTLLIWAIVLFCVKMKEQAFTFIPLNEPLEGKVRSPTVFSSIFSETLKLQISFFSLGLLLVAQTPWGFSGRTPRKNCFYLSVAIVDVWLVHSKNFGNVSLRVFQS